MKNNKESDTTRTGNFLKIQFIVPRQFFTLLLRVVERPFCAKRDPPAIEPLWVKRVIQVKRGAKGDGR